MKQKRRTSKNSHIVLVGIIILIFLFIFGFALSQEFKKHFMPPPKSMTQTSPKLLLPELAKAMEIKPDIRESKYWNWVNENDTVLPLKGSEFSIGSINGIGKDKPNKDDDLSQFTLTFFQPIFATANSVFRTNGLIPNARNTNSAPDQYGVIYGGYEKGELKCLYNFMERSDPFGRFFCGYVDEEQLALQQEFKNLFKTKPIPGQQPPLLRIEKVFGDAALGNYAEGAGPGGYTFMAKKSNGNWQVVWRGQEIALCSDMQKYQIPKEVYGTCYQQ